MTEIDPLQPYEVVAIYFAQCQARPGKVPPRQDMGFDPGLVKTLIEAQKIRGRNALETLKLRAVAIAYDLSRKKYFPKYNAIVAISATLFFLTKNGFAIREEELKGPGTSKAILTKWVDLIAIPPGQR